MGKEGNIAFAERDGGWDQVHLVLPEPVWERIYEEGYLLYEGYTVDHKAFGAGRVYLRDGSVYMEGEFGLKGFLSGKVFYPDGRIRFDGICRLNEGYGMNYPEYGSFYGEGGGLVFHGKFRVSRSSLGWPWVVEPEGFGPVPHADLKGHQFMWEDARKYMKQGKEDREHAGGC